MTRPTLCRPRSRKIWVMILMTEGILATSSRSEKALDKPQQRMAHKTISSWWWLC